MDMKSVCLCVLVLSLLFECGQSDYSIDSGYRVHLPVISWRPNVTETVVNGDTISTTPGDKLIRNQVISRTSLPLTSSKGVGGGSPAYKRFRRQPQSSANDHDYASAFAQYIQKHPVGEDVPVERIALQQSSISNRDSSPFFGEYNSNPFAEPMRKRTRPEHDFSITTEECGLVAGDEVVPLIHNGQSYERGDLPWLVAIYRIVQKNLKFICGGTLVSDRHVISAAHCMSQTDDLTPIIEIVVKIGVHSLNDWSDDLTVTRKLMAATIHEDFNPATLQNDMLVLTLNKRVKFNKYIRPACLWSADTELSRVVGATGVVAGWGDRGMGGIGKHDEPQIVRVPIVSTKECRASKSEFHKLTYDNTLCAGDRNGVGPCNGDSGGGLYLLDGGKWRLRGVVSVSLRRAYGGRICNLNEYVVYTDTAQFLPWIRNILSEKYYD